MIKRTKFDSNDGNIGLLILEYQFVLSPTFFPQAEESARDCVRGDDQQQGRPAARRTTHQKEELSGQDRTQEGKEGGRKQAEEGGRVFAPGRIAQPAAKYRARHGMDSLQMISNLDPKITWPGHPLRPPDLRVT